MWIFKWRKTWILKRIFSREEIKFEGDYLNGHRPKGKELKDGKLIFEGEYLNDIRWVGNRFDVKRNIRDNLNNDINGKVLEYADESDLIYDDKKIIFEGEYLNGMRNGHGKEYDFYSDGNKYCWCLTFEGE